MSTPPPGSAPSPRDPRWDRPDDDIPSHPPTAPAVSRRLVAAIGAAMVAAIAVIIVLVLV